jgi:hypothetical protein
MPTISKIMIFCFPVQYLRMSMFLILLYTMGLATAVSILIGLMHLSPKISQPQSSGLIWKFAAFFLDQISVQFQLSHLFALCFFRLAAFWVLWSKNFPANFNLVKTSLNLFIHSPRSHRRDLHRAPSPTKAHSVEPPSIS